MEASGYLYDPFTPQNLFGTPDNVMIGPVPPILGSGHDTSALPELSNPAFANPRMIQSSATAAAPPRRSEVWYQQGRNDYSLAAFIGVLAIAFLWQRS